MTQSSSSCARNRTETSNGSQHNLTKKGKGTKHIENRTTDGSVQTVQTETHKASQSGHQKMRQESHHFFHCVWHSLGHRVLSSSVCAAAIMVSIVFGRLAKFQSFCRGLHWLFGGVNRS
eukprot:4877807-Amphidinium_carterae.1